MILSGRPLAAPGFVLLTQLGREASITRWAGALMGVAGMGSIVAARVGRAAARAAPAGSASGWRRRSEPAAEDRQTSGHARPTQALTTKNGSGTPVSAYLRKASILVAQPIVHSRTPSTVAKSM